MGQLWEYLQTYLDKQDGPMSDRTLAALLGYSSSSTLAGWRTPKDLPKAEHLARAAQLTGESYHRLLDAALHDIGYLPVPEPAEPVGLTRRKRRAT